MVNDNYAHINNYASRFLLFLGVTPCRGKTLYSVNFFFVEHYCKSTLL